MSTFTGIKLIEPTVKCIHESMILHNGDWDLSSRMTATSPLGPATSLASDAATPDGGAAGVAGAADVQLREVRDRLVRDAGTAGVDEQLVRSAVDQAAAALAQAPVRGFSAVRRGNDVFTGWFCGVRVGDAVLG
jgi:hypothetical protein